jgi:hypothetical protein
MNAAIPERRPASGGNLRRHRARHFPQRRKWFLCPPRKNKGTAGGDAVVGSLPSVTAGERLVAEGWWVRDKEHGLQFKASTMKAVPQTTAEAPPSLEVVIGQD